VDIEKIKAKCMRDAEEAFSKELRRLGVVVEGESESYHTASSRKKRDVVKDNVVQFLMVQGVPGGMDGGRRGPGPPRSESC
jgi:6-phosphogluconate dehydrogenase